MTLLSIKGLKNKVILDHVKAALLNDYLKKGYIKMINKDRNDLKIEIINNNHIVKHSILN